MTEREIQQHIATLHRWLTDAWRRLSDPSLTSFDRRELRNQMKEANASLRQCLALSVELKSVQKQDGTADVRAFAKPDLRFLA